MVYLDLYILFCLVHPNFHSGVTPSVTANRKVALCVLSFDASMQWTDMRFFTFRVGITINNSNANTQIQRPSNTARLSARRVGHGDSQETISRCVRFVIPRVLSLLCTLCIYI